MLKKKPIQLVLNTGETTALDPCELYVESDHLYQKVENGCIKFTDRALVALAPYLEEEEGVGLRIRIGETHWYIPYRTAQ
jgi:hypothetical protein